MERVATYMSSFASLRETMERCSDIVAEAYIKPINQLEMYTGELPPGHRGTDRRQRYWVTERGGDMFVALPGTTHPLDWSSNLRVHYQPIDGMPVPGDQLESVPCAHAGFYYRSETVPTLQLLQQAADRGCRLILTGHSLGGAVANLCTLTALSAQKRALAAAADKAETAANPKRGSRSSRRGRARLESHRAAAAAAANKDNHSCCSSNSDVVLSPQAALVEVLCVSFASPVYANAALVKHIEDSGWEENFVNIVVPEDYCLKLFNNVLTSANPEGLTISRASSRSSLKGDSKQLADYAESPDAYDPVPEPYEPADEPTPDLSPPASMVLSAAAATATAENPHSSSGSGSNDSNSADSEASSSGGHTPHISCTRQQPRPLSALAGKNGRSSRSKRQLKFAQPLHQLLDDGTAAESSGAAASAAADSASRLRGLNQGTFSGSNWADDDDELLPSSPSSASLYSEDSSSSARSWTLLAYLPGMLTRSFNTRSSSGWGSAGRDTETGMTAEAAEDVFASWGMRHARSSIDLTQGVSLSGSDDGGSNSSSTGSMCSLEDLEAAATFFTGMRSVQEQHAGQQLQQQQQEEEEEVQEVDGHSHKQHHLHRSYSSASMTILNQGHQKLQQPQLQMNPAKPSDSLSMVAKLLPSARSVVSASRSVIRAASSLTDKALSVPLDVLEVGLVRALKPPMYQPVGQQWILSATGLVPQQQPMNQYPRHVHDVFWHKELLLVAFREHSITFYKQRLLKQASRR